MGKRTAQKDTIKDITSNSQVNSYFPYKWSRWTRTVHRMNSSFPTGGRLATLIANRINFYFCLFSILNYKTELNMKHNGQLLKVFYSIYPVQKSGNMAGQGWSFAIPLNIRDGSVDVLGELKMAGTWGFSNFKGKGFL